LIGYIVKAGPVIDPSPPFFAQKVTSITFLSTLRHGLAFQEAAYLMPKHKVTQLPFSTIGTTLNKTKRI